jgi:DNA-binding NtrC family response regulator
MMIAAFVTPGNPTLPRRILIIDDEESIRALLDEYLEIVGFDVQTAASGFEGLDALQRDAYGLVICDVSMPGMDGFTVFEKVLQLKPNQNFLFITGYNIENSKKHLKDKSLGLLRKPFQLDDLFLIISDLYPDVQRV